MVSAIRVGFGGMCTANIAFCFGMLSRQSELAEAKDLNFVLIGVMIVANIITIFSVLHSAIYMNRIKKNLLAEYDKLQLKSRLIPFPHWHFNLEAISAIATTSLAIIGWVWAYNLGFPAGVPTP